MKMKLIVSIAALAMTTEANAQLTPRPSPKASVSQTVGTTNITIEYHRPGVKNRAIWGGLVPFDTPWRMGANEATTITFSTPVRVEGQEVPAGTYSFFAIPSRDKWTLVINKDAKQWGAYGYDQTKDQARVQVTPTKAPHTEWMRFTIDPVSPSSALVTLNWEGTAVPMKVDVDVEKNVWTAIDAAMVKAREQESQMLGAAAGFALETGQRLPEGLAWIDRSIAVREDVFNLWTKARLLQKAGRAKEAVPVMEKSLALAKKDNMPADFMAILNGTMDSIRNDAKK